MGVGQISIIPAQETSRDFGINFLEWTCEQLR